METTKIHGGTLTFSEGRHQYHWNSEKVKHTVSGICGEGYPLPFGVPAAWAAKIIREELLQELTDQEMIGFDDPKEAQAWAKHVCSAHTRARDSAGGAGTAFHDDMERYRFLMGRLEGIKLVDQIIRQKLDKHSEEF